MSLQNDLLKVARQAREASIVLGNLSTSTKNSALEGMAEALLQSASKLKRAMPPMFNRPKNLGFLPP